MKTCSQCLVSKPRTFEYFYHRNTADGYHQQCKECMNANKRKNYLASKGQWHAKHKEWIENNKERHKKYQRKYRKANKEKALIYGEKYREDNREKLRELYRDHYSRNREAYMFRAVNRKAGKLKATPKWFEEELVKKVYDEAKKRGLSVDHIVPLKSKRVSGLHCWHNLQLLDRSENCAKNNRFWPDM